eukprot:symbB.v1.2.016949.t1/scaffold1306.1/size125945/8
MCRLEDISAVPFFEGVMVCPWQLLLRYLATTNVAGDWGCAAVAMARQKEWAQALSLLYSDDTIPFRLDPFALGVVVEACLELQKVAPDLCKELQELGSKTLVVTDSLISIPEEPPELLMDPVYSKALAYHARDTATEVASVSDPSVRRKGWARIALFATFFNPGALANGDVQIPEAEVTRPWQWQKRWEESFQRLRQNGAPFVAPIIQELILKQQPERTSAYVDTISSWDFQRAVSAHFDCPIALSPKQFRDKCFGFLKRPMELPYCAEDVKFLTDLQESAIPNGQAVRVGKFCGFQPRA